MDENAALEKALEERGLKLLESQQFPESPEPGYWRQLKILVGGHLELDPDWLVSEPRLGVLGTIVRLRPGEDPENQVCVAVNQATYLRHLLVSWQDAQGPSTSVELVLVFAQENAAAVGRKLQELAHSTDVLHAIGINLLPVRPGAEPLAASDLRRAFCWLLWETKRWYRSGFLRRTSNRGAHRRLASIALENFRIAGTRTLELSAREGIRVHLIHGHNGSGKSTIVEALELAWTGRIDRLGAPEAQKYLQILRHQNEDDPGNGSDLPVTCTLSFFQEKPGEPVEVAALCSRPPQPLRPHSFRLNQTIISQLVSLEPAERSKIFLDAFFPEESAQLVEYEAAERSLDTSLQALPQHLRARVESGDLEAPFWTWETLRAFLPISWESLEWLARLTGDELGTAVKEVPEREVLSHLEICDRVLDQIQARQGLRDQLLAVKTALEAMEGWQAKGRKLRGDFSSRLNRWLELTALADIASRHLEVARILSDADQGGWRQDPNFPNSLSRVSLSEKEWEQLDAQAKSWGQERDEILGEIVSGAGAGAGEAVPGEAATRSLSRSEIVALNALGVWLSGEKAANTLGDALDHALNSDSLATLGSLTLGSPGWADPLKAAVTSSLAVLDQLKQPDDGRDSRRAEGRYRQAKEVLEKRNDLVRRRTSIHETFLHRIRAPDSGKAAGEPILDRALNEVLWLFTPARWAYEALALAYQPSQNAAPPSVSLKTGTQGSEAVLRYNTAELNVFALALFLLCAVRIDNPYRLLILDDPLQNMDELTVTTVARGLARLVGLLPEGWEILGLFHGEDDLERFRRELPASVYLMKWHRYGSAEKEDIELDGTRSWTSAAVHRLPPDWIKLRE